MQQKIWQVNCKFFWQSEFVFFAFLQFRNQREDDVILETAESKERLDGCGWFSIVILYTIIW